MVKRGGPKRGSSFGPIFIFNTSFPCWGEKWQGLLIFFGTTLYGFPPRDFMPPVGGFGPLKTYIGFREEVCAIPY